MKEKIKEICEVLGLSFEEEIKKNEEKPEIIKEEEKPTMEEVEEEKPEIIKEEEKPKVEEVKKKMVIFPEEEKLEYLKREEVRTMEKDVEKLREIEAEKERERISALEAEAKKIKVLPHPKEAMPQKETILPKPPQKPSRAKKILIRIGIILIFFLFLTFFYWYFGIKKPSTPKIIEKPPVEKEEKKVEEKPEILIPPSLISVEKVISPEISKIEDIPKISDQINQEVLSEGKFTQIAIKNKSDNRLVSIEEISPIYQIEVPEGFFQKLEKESSTLALFGQKEGKRIVFLAKVKEETGLKELLKNWEEKISKEGVFVSGSKITTLSPYFRTSSYQNVGFRYLTISKEDLGICYAWFDNYFVFTTSFEGMKKIIEEIKGI